MLIVLIFGVCFCSLVNVKKNSGSSNAKTRIYNFKILLLYKKILIVYQLV
jgi:hypothetical protein